LADNITDSDSNNLISRSEIQNSTDTKKAPYVKLYVYQKDINNANPGDVIIKLRAFGHNHRTGNGVIERAIEVNLK